MHLLPTAWEQETFLHRVEITITAVGSRSSGVTIVIAQYVPAHGNSNTGTGGGVVNQTIGVR